MAILFGRVFLGFSGFVQKSTCFFFPLFSQQKGRIGLETKRGGLAQIGSNANVFLEKSLKITVLAIIV